MEIVLNTLDCLTANAEMVAKKIRELISSKADTGIVKFSLDLNHPEFVTIKVVNNSAYLYYSKDGRRFTAIQCEIPNVKSKTGAETVKLVKQWLEEIDSVIEIVMREYTEFTEKCYEAYKLDWMISHGYSLRDYLNALIEVAEEIDNDEEQEIEGDSRDKLETYDSEFEYERGFGSATIWACKNEFLWAEFQDQEYMKHLISMMPCVDWKEYIRCIEYMEGTESEVEA